MKEILVHLNIEVGDDYPRSPAELGSLVRTLVETGLTDDLALDGRTFTKPSVSVPLVEEV